MWLFTFSLLIFLQNCCPIRAETNFFKKLITKFQNDEISPCDDFFRHICPRQMTNEDSYNEFTTQMAKDWRTPGDVWVSEMLKDVVTNKFERISYVEKLATRAALLYALQNESHPMHDYSYERLEKMHEKMTDIVLKELNFPENAPYAKKLREKWNRRFEKQRHVFGMSHENVTDALNYLKFYGEFQANYSDYLRDYDRPQFDNIHELQTRFEELALIGWKLFDLESEFGKKSHSIEETEVSNAFNIGQTSILLTETIFSGIMKKDIPEAVLANCSSGTATWTEDGPDIEGVQLAWKLFKEQMGDNRKELLYPKLNITHEQMFFYGFPSVTCNEYWRVQHSYNPITRKVDSHSGGVQRYNAVYSLLKPFQEAFSCKPEDKMVQRSQCNYFGEDVRR